MRLIDGDALKRRCQKVATEAWKAKMTTSVEKVMNQVIDFIEEAPTIQPDAPRVMTMEEVLGGDECWIEGRNGACGYGDALLTCDGERVDFYRPHSIDTLDFYEYGLSWRCWTSRPTDEQRKATAWELQDAADACV